MSSNSFPVSNNNNVLPIKQTTPNPFELKGEFNQLGFAFISKIEGYIFPTVPGNYPVLNIDGDQISLPTCCYINSIGLKSVGSLPLTGDGLSIQTSIGQAQILTSSLSASIARGYLIGSSVKAFSAANAPGKLIAETVGTFRPDTCIKIIIYYMALE